MTQPTRKFNLQTILLLLALFFLGVAAWLHFLSATLPKFTVLKLDPIAEMTRAELVYLHTTYEPRAVLVLCPGYNGNGGELIRQKEWREFAARHQLGLVGLSFASDELQLQNNQGYYYADRGSGALFLNGIRHIFGRDLPLLLYGFSGGAHFTARLSEWRGDRVLAWCAYSAAWWDEPKKQKNGPFGIVACGLADIRSAASRSYFDQGRLAGRNWIWVGMPEVDHAWNFDLDDFVRDYFSAVLEKREGVWVNQTTGTLTQNPSDDHPENTGFLPDAKLLPKWSKLVRPTNP